MEGVLLITLPFGWLEVCLCVCVCLEGVADAAQRITQHCLALENLSLYLDFMLTAWERNAATVTQMVALFMHTEGLKYNVCMC